jgi:hypothetical protein
MRSLNRYNERKTYQCPNCKKWFRLKSSLLNHDCKENPKRKRND